MSKRSNAKRKAARLDLLVKRIIAENEGRRCGEEIKLSKPRKAIGKAKTKWNSLPSGKFLVKGQPVKRCKAFSKNGW